MESEINHGLHGFIKKHRTSITIVKKKRQHLWSTKSDIDSSCQKKKKKHQEVKITFVLVLYHVRLYYNDMRLHYKQTWSAGIHTVSGILSFLYGVSIGSLGFCERPLVHVNALVSFVEMELSRHTEL